MLKRALVSFACLCSLASAQAFADILEAIIEPPLVDQIKLSPDGNLMAIRVFEENKRTLRFIERKTMKPVGGMVFPGRLEPGAFYWVNNTRVIAQVISVEPGNELPTFYGELFAMNFDGSQPATVFGYNSGENQTATHIRKRDPDYAWANLIDPLPEDPEHALIAVQQWNSAPNLPIVVRKLNVYTGIEGPELYRATSGEAEFWTDANGNLVLVRSLRTDGSVGLRARPVNQTAWLDIPDAMYSDRVKPVAITPDGLSAYVLDQIERDKMGLYELPFDGSPATLIYQNERVDISEVFIGTDSKTSYALRIDDGSPSYVLLDKEQLDAVILKQLLTTFPGNLVSIVSRSRDGRFWIIQTSSDVSDSRFYLFDRQAGKLAPLFKSRGKLNSSEMATTTPIVFRSFDGLPISGYFTQGKAEKPSLIVMVHDGPASRDVHEFSPRVQLLASQGFSVLQINYRGSTGYGSAFLNAGRREWGRNIQKDLIAGTEWALEQKLANNGRACIIGRGFGAYSALMSATLAPDLFACVVAESGFYDLSMLYEKGRRQQLYAGDAFLEANIGRDKEELERYSPINRINLLQAPVLISHSRSDVWTPFVHAKQLRRELDRQNKQYDWVINSTSGRPQSDFKTQLAYVRTLIAFLHKHLREHDPE